MDAESFAEAAQGLHHRLLRAVWAISEDRSLAEDCAQEALLRAWERVDRGDQLASLEAWSLTVALNHARSRFRRRNAEHRALSRLASGPDAEPRSERLGDDVRRAVASLPDRQREVVVLHYLLDLDVASIGAVCGTSVGAVKNALFHARTALARALAPDDSPTAATTRKESG